MGAKTSGGRNGRNRPKPSSDRPRPSRPEETSPRETYARLEATLDALPDLLFVLDREGRICDYHAPNPDRLYVPPKEFLGRKMVDVLPEPAAGVVRRAIADAAVRGFHRGSVYPLSTPSGERWFEISIAAHGDPQTPGGRLVAIARDVTERVQTEEALRESEAKYRLLTEGMKDVVWTLDVEARRFTYVSPSVEALRGYTAEETLAQPLEEAWVPAERERLFALLQGYVADFLAGKIDETTYVPIEFFQPCKDGSTVPSEAVCHLVRNPRTGRLELHGVTRDISRRVRAENALRESEARFAQTTRQSRAFVWEVDATGLYMFVTPVVEDVLGYRPDEIAGRLHFYDLHPAEGREAFKAATFDVVRRHGEFRDFENPMVAKDGRTAWVSTNAFPLLDGNGQLLGYRGVDFDVTARKQAQDALRESEARFAATARASRSFVWEVDPDGLFTHVDGMVAEVLGYRPEELVGRMHFYDLLIEEGLEDLKQACFGVMARRETISGFENANRAKDGRLVWTASSARPLFNADGSFRGYQGIDTDVTERKLAREALRESELRLRALTDNLPGGLVYQMDTGVDGRERRLLAVSKGVERLHGVTAEEALGAQKTFYLQVVPEDQARVAALEAHAVATLTPFHAEVRCRMPTGEIRWIYVSSAPRRLSNGHLVWDGIEIDVTERKQAEEAVRLSEAKYRHLHETMRDAFATADMRGRIQEFNPAFLELTGYSAAELRKLSYRKLTPRKWQAAEAKILKEQVLPRGYSDVYEKEYRRKDGALVPVELRTILIRDGQGRPTGMWAAMRDVSERKRAEEALRLSESKYRLLFENMQDAYAAMDLRGRLLDCNPAFENLVGYSRKELLRLHLADLTPPEWMAVEMKAIAQMRRRGYSKRFEKEYVRKDGTRVPVELQGSLRRDARGRPAGFWAIMRDVSERKRAELSLRQAHDDLERRVQERTAELVASRQALAESEEQFRQMAENVQEAFWLIDVRTRQALYVSPAFKKIWNWPVEKTVTRWFARIHPEDRERVVQAFQTGMKAGIPGTIVYRLLWPDGSIRWIESFGSMIRDARGRPSRAAGLHRDVTERRRLEEEILKAAEAERQRIGRDLHDSLGQSLTAIGYLADAVREDLARRRQPEAAAVRKLGRLIEKAASQSHAMARGLLLADVKRGGLAAALQELALRSQELFGIACRYSGSATPPAIDANVAGQLYRIAQEAIANAAKHGKAQRIDVRLATGQHGLLLTVQDNGKGIASGRPKRTGLGLDIMRYRAGMIGATLEFDGKPRRGTTVRCRLPLAPPAPRRKK
ncbi:MAG: PAS domain S-box protein [Kiritimatiellia bacterium]